MCAYRPIYEIPEKGKAIIPTNIVKICDSGPNLYHIAIGVVVFDFGESRVCDLAGVRDM